MNRTKLIALSAFIITFSIHAFAEDYIALNNAIGELRKQYVALKEGDAKFNDVNLKNNYYSKTYYSKWDPKTIKLIVTDDEAARKPCANSKQNTQACTGTLKAYKSQLMEALAAVNKAKRTSVPIKTK